MTPAFRNAPPEGRERPVPVREALLLFLLSLALVGCAGEVTAPEPASGEDHRVSAGPSPLSGDPRFRLTIHGRAEVM